MQRYDISTHVPHKRYDKNILSLSVKAGVFQLTYLTRGTTLTIITIYLSPPISTHVPHKRYDSSMSNSGNPAIISTHVPHKRYDL